MMNNLLALIGRILISAIFIYEGADSILYMEKTRAMMIEYGLTWKTDTLLYGSIVLLVVGAIMLLIGYRIRFGVWLLLIYWLPLTFIVYSFWNDPAEMRRLNAILFMKNLAIAGGLIMIAAHGGGRYAVQRLYQVSRIPRDT